MTFPTFEQLQARGTLKWTRYPDDVLPLWIAESDFDTCPAVQHALEQAVNRQSFGYPPSEAGVCDATAQFYSDWYGFAAKEDWVAVVPDVMRGLMLCVEHFTPPHSPVIIPLPAYPPFVTLLDATKRHGVFLDASTGLDVAEVEQAFANGARALIICNPYNPLGRVYSTMQLRELTTLAQQYSARIFVDEIHAPLVYDRSHVVAAGVSDVAAQVCITVTATSKAWNTAGLKCAQIIFSNPEDVRAWRRIDHLSKDGVSILGLVAAEAAYRHGRDFLEQELQQLKSNRDYLTNMLPHVLPGVGITVPAATYLMWLDLSHTAITGNKAEFLLKHAKVAVNDGATFGEPGAEHVRLNFATSQEILDEALQRIDAAVTPLYSPA